MKLVKQLLTATIMAAFLLPACQSEKSGDEGSKDQEQAEDQAKQQSKDGKTQTRYDEKPGKLPHEALDAKDLLPELEEGQTLALDSVSKLHLERMNGYIRNHTPKMEDLRSSAYKKLKADLAKEIQGIEGKSGLSGKAAEKRDQLLKQAKNQLKKLESDDRQACQIALLNLATIMEAFGKHFD